LRGSVTPEWTGRLFTKAPTREADVPLLDKIRDEIVETQKIQAEFTRWKLLLIAAVGAAGLGVAPVASGGHPTVLLGLLPFVCLYADALVYNSGVRVLATARWLRIGRESHAPAGGADGDFKSDHSEFRALSKYEHFLRAHRKHFNLEVIALVGASVSTSLVVMTIGFVNLLARAATPDTQSMRFVQASHGEAQWLVVSGILGILLAGALYFRHCRKVRFFDRDE
jgi:hypothetical protein